MKILHKYILKEHLGPLVFSLTTLTSLLLLNYIAKRFGDLVGKGLPWSVIGKFFGLSIPFTVALTFPMAVLVATLYAFGRLASENEITALRASGVSLRAILTPVLIASFGLTVFMVIFNDQIMPNSNHTLAKLQMDIARTKPTFALREQVINEVQPGRLYLRANHLDEGSNKMREVTIYDLSDGSRRRTIYADSGNMAMAPNYRDLLMTLYDGSMQDVPTDNPSQLQRLFFDEDLIVVRNVANQYSQDSGAMVKGDREMTVCEMQNEVKRLEDEYGIAQTRLARNLEIARKNGVEISPDVAEADLSPKSGRTIGWAYCAFLSKIGLKSWTAPPDTVPEDDWMYYGGSPYSQFRMPMLPAYDPSLPDISELGLPDSILYNPLYQDSIQKLLEAHEPKVDPVILESDRIVMTQRTYELARYEVEIHKKFALAVACFVFTLLGAPIALRFPRGGVGMTIGVSLVVFAIYYVGLITGSSLAIAGRVPAWASMWAANAIFTVLALYLISRMGKESSTSRGGGLQDKIDAWKEKLSRSKKRTGNVSIGESS